MALWMLAPPTERFIFINESGQEDVAASGTPRSQPFRTSPPPLPGSELRTAARIDASFLVRSHRSPCAIAGFYPHPNPLPAREREEREPHSNPLPARERERSFHRNSCGYALGSMRRA